MKTGKGYHITTFAFAFGIFFLAMLTAIMIFTSVSNQFSQRSSLKTLSDFTDTVSSAVNARVSEQFSVLKGYSNILSSKKNIDTDSVRHDMASIAETGGFDSLSVALPDGTAFSQLDERYNISGSSYFQKAMNGSVSAEKIFAAGSEQGYIVLCVPVYKDGAVIAALFAKLPNSALEDSLSISAYDGKSEAFVTDGTGRIVIGSTSGVYSENTDYLNVISSARMLNGITAGKLAEDLKNGLSDEVIFESGGIKRYAVFIPLGIGDWTLFNIVSGKTADAETNALNRNILGLGINAILFAVPLFIILGFHEAKYSRQLLREADAIRQSEQRYRVVQEFSEGVIFEADLLTDEIHFNSNYEQVFSHPPFIKTASDFVAIQPMVFIDDAQDLARFGQKMMKGEPARGIIDYRVCGTPDKPVWHRLEYRTITNTGGRPVKIIGRLQNIDDEKTHLLQLQVMAESDSLTGLCNNAAFKEKVDHYLQNDGQNGEHVLMIIDLDDFKCVNDTFGHVEGDRILQLFGAKVKPLFRTSDIIGRIGGDEFAIFVKDFSRIRGIAAKAEDICELVSVLGGSYGSDFTTTCSIGISLYKRDGSNFLELFKKADTALYQAKRIGKGRFSIYDPTFNIIGAR